MNNKEKQLLLIDLSARVLYDTVVKVDCKNESYDEVYLRSVDTFGDKIEVAHYAENIFPIDVIKPYLRPMSSMTEEERKEYKHLVAFSGSSNGAANMVDWLNKKKFAYRTIDGKDMFELGLALQAPKGMYGKETEK